jgi:hypothetical protein
MAQSAYNVKWHGHCSFYVSVFLSCASEAGSPAVSLIVSAGALSCEGAGPVTETQLRRSTVLRELCGSSVGATTLALSLEAFRVWQAYADDAEALDGGSVTALNALTIWQVCCLVGPTLLSVCPNKNVRCRCCTASPPLCVPQTR